MTHAHGLYRDTRASPSAEAEPTEARPAHSWVTNGPRSIAQALPAAARSLRHLTFFRHHHFRKTRQSSRARRAGPVI